MNQLIQKVTQKMQAQKLSSLIVSDPISIDYLIGYHTHPGERLLALLIQADGQVHLILNRLFPEYQGSQGLNIIYYNDGDPVIQDLAKMLTGGIIGIDKLWPSHFLIDLLHAQPDLEVVHGSPIIDQLRSIKQAHEIELMTKASQLNDQAMQVLISQISKAHSEEDMKDILAQTYRELGCQGFSFEPIIAYGPNGADPHHTTSNAYPQAGQTIVLDIGSSYQGYCSDMTRTIFFGQASPEDRHIYETVLKANLKAIQQVKPGVSFASIDQAARQVIEEAGYGPYFTHRTGHSIGREVHEAGDVGPQNQDLVQVGQIFSIEPGIYLPGKMGVRIEDLVVVTEDGCQVLNQANKELIQVEIH